MEEARLSPSALRRGRFSEGLERLADTPRKRRQGSYADGLGPRAENLLAKRRGSFAVGQRRDGRH
jgi:hypothetical protein